jgi:hypothetical protein
MAVGVMKKPLRFLAAMGIGLPELVALLKVPPDLPRFGNLLKDREKETVARYRRKQGRFTVSAGRRAPGL